MTEQRYGRPRGQGLPAVYTERLHTKVSPDQRAWLEAEATRRQITVAELIRTLIEWAREGEQTPAELYAQVRATPDKPLSPRAAAWAKAHKE